MVKCALLVILCFLKPLLTVYFFVFFRKSVYLVLDDFDLFLTFFDDEVNALYLLFIFFTGAVFIGFQGVDFIVQQGNGGIRHSFQI